MATAPNLTGMPSFNKAENVLILLPDRDSPPAKDWKNVFSIEAKALKDVYAEDEMKPSVKVVQIKVPTVDPKTLTINSATKQLGFEDAARSTVDAIRNGNTSGRWDRIIIICHGWDTGIQLGFRIAKQRGEDKKNMADLIGTLKFAKPKTITLFACSAGDEPASKKSSPGTGDESFADYLRDNVGCSVLGHWSAGHATRNPDLILFEASSAPRIGGVAWPEQGTAAYRNAAKLLSTARNPKTGLSFGRLNPVNHTRPAFTSLPLCSTVSELTALLSAKPAY